MDNKKKIAAAVAATIAASGAAVDASFDDPADLLQQDAAVEPHVQYVDLENDQDQPSDDEKQKASESSKGGPVRDWILGLPLGVRALFVLPFWFIGHLLIMGGSLLLTGLSPILHWLLGLVIIAAVIAGAYTAAVKAIFPDIPIGRILNRQSIKWILIAAGAVWLADLLLGVFWAGYARFKALILGLFTLIAIGSVVLWFVRRENRRRRKLAEEEAEEEARREAEADLVYTSLGQTFTVRRKP